MAVIYPQVLNEDPFVYSYYYYPFLLKQDCNLIDAGYNYIDETKLIGRTTDMEGTPDSNITDIGFHYILWNYVNAGDGNMLSADLNQDDVVNFGDFAVLANYWQQATSEEADIDESGFVDYNDVYMLADEWLWVAEPNIQLQIIGDGNNGYVEVGASGYTSDTQRIILLADGQYVREILGFKSGYTVGVDISEYGDGEKQLKTVCVDNDDRITCSEIKNVTFSCPLNYCFLPETYEPNKPLYFSAFNPSGGNVTVKAYADDVNLVWSQSYSGESFFGSIPVEITGQYDFDYISFDTGGGGMLKEGGAATMDAGDGGSITKFSDLAIFGLPGEFRALIILPELNLNRLDVRQTAVVQKVFKDKGIKYVKLRVKHATYDKVAKFTMYNDIKYIYFDGHGGFGKDPSTGEYDFFNEEHKGVLRTNVSLYDRSVVSIKKSDFPNGGVPSWCEDLGYWEKRIKSFASMDFYDVEFAYFDCCYSGRLKINDHDQLVEGEPGAIGQAYDGPQSDMSFALRMNEPSRTRVYQGWYGKAISSVWPVLSAHQSWTQDEWGKLGEGENLYWALEYAILQQIWHGPTWPSSNVRFKGQGLFMDIILTGN